MIDLVLDVYAAQERSLEQAKIQVLNSTKAQIEQGLELNDDVVAVRVHETSTSTPRSNSGINEDPTSQDTGGFTGAPRTVTIVMSVLALTAVGFVVYKKLSNRRDDVDSVDGAPLDDFNSSITSGEVDNSLVDVEFDSDSPACA